MRFEGFWGLGLGVGVGSKGVALRDLRCGVQGFRV